MIECGRGCNSVDRGKIMVKVDAESGSEQFHVVLQLTLAWTLLWVAFHHYTHDSLKTFHDASPFTSQAFGFMMTFLAEYGYLLIGLSLISKLFAHASHAIHNFPELPH